MSSAEMLLLLLEEEAPPLVVLASRASRCRRRAKLGDSHVLVSPLNKPLRFQNTDSRRGWR